MKIKTISKHKLLLFFIKHSDSNCECHFYGNPTFSSIPKTLLYELIDELVAEDYLEKRLRAVRLKAKAYSYKHDRRMYFANKLISVLGRPISYLIAWVLGICSTLLTQYLINILHLNS